MAQQLRALALLPEDPGPISSTTMVSYKQSVSRLPKNPIPSLTTVGTVQTWYTYMHIDRRNTQTHKIKTNICINQSFISI